ncbi:MAG: family 10 glycosylhydrolase, partial [Bacteroidota bacterium]
MKILQYITLSLLFLLLSLAIVQAQAYRNNIPPKHEMRGVWVATVNNIDYPKRPTPIAIAQKEQWRKLIEKLKRAGMNAVYVQVRPSADALYASSFVPFSKFLTGRQGRSPEPFYDPMQSMIEIAHEHGMEFHAWLNPYRATTNLDTLNLSLWHVFNRHREWLVQYDNKFYINPGVPEARRHIVQVVEEIVDNYDIDGIHLDDYFYPYKKEGQTFVDSTEFKKYGEVYGSVEDWRRNNNDQLIESIAVAIKKKKPYVKFGISPFGVWRNKEDDPDGSESQAGVTSYDDLYADVRGWLKKSYIDYVAPQLYWYIGHPKADHEELLYWWTSNLNDKKLLVGHAAYKIGEQKAEAWQDPAEMIRQVKLNRKVAKAQGSIFFSAKSILKNPLGLVDSLRTNYYRYPAVPPVIMPDDAKSPKVTSPKLKKIKSKSNGVEINWKINKPVPTAGFGMMPPDYYIIYRFEDTGLGNISDPRNIIGISSMNGNQCAFLDKTAIENQIYTYTVTA